MGKSGPIRYARTVPDRAKPLEAALDLCHRHRRAGEMQAARDALAHVEAPPTEAEELVIHQAVIEAWIGRSPVALGLLPGAPTGARGQALAQWVLGDVDFAAGRWAEARARFGAALNEIGSPLTASERARVRRSAALAALELGDVESARADMEKAVTEGANDPEKFWDAALLETLATPHTAERSLSEALQEARRLRWAEVEWQIHARLSAFERDRGAPLRSRKHAEAAVEVLEAMAASLPPEDRGAFWSSRHRARLRDQAAPNGTAPAVQQSEAPTRQLRKLLENLRRLAGERDVDRLLERIVDTAIELSSAERGFVLLADENGELVPKTVRAVEKWAGEATAAFSQSIAELVMIDGEPLVTVDAAHDPRVSEYLSVHRLMLRSVACFPIESRGRVLGVLYLEHREGVGRFADSDVKLLRAFADQAAIALETAELFDEVATQREELRRANDDLSQANAELQATLDAKQTALEATREQLGRLEGTPNAEVNWGLVGNSEPMQRVFAVVERVSHTEVPVLIYGDSGTGKELVARAIHEHGPRADKPFVCLSSGSIPESLIEAELFGHEAGAFTGADRVRQGIFERASGGTLFLDELPEMPKKMQVELLRVLQERQVQRIGATRAMPVDVRILAASQVPLQTLIAQGRFREDLYYRMSVVEIQLPPLRDRIEDLPALCDHLLKRLARRGGGSRKRLTRPALAALRDFPFPGNVRQLEHLLLNASVFCHGDTIDVGDLMLGQEPAGSTDAATEPPATSYQHFKEGEREKILAALDACGWNRAKAARMLGIPRRTFYRRLREHGIALPADRD